MAVVSSFDQWQKDVFFSAAEEVQESADTMESVYRMWVRERSDGFEPEISDELPDELRRELHTTLGTAKWQLEEFERAVSLSHEIYPSEDNTITRHREFIAAIGSQISHIEKVVNDSLLEEGKQPHRWVQLDEEERDDFEVFLSSAPQTLQETKDKCNNCKSVRGFKEIVIINKDAKYVVEVAAKEPFANQCEVILQEENLNGQRRAGSSPDWKIVIADEEDVERKRVDVRPDVHNRASSLCGFLRNIESTAKLKWFRNSLIKAKSGEHIQLKQGLSNYFEFKGITRFAQGITGLSERSRSCFSSSKEDSKGSNIQQIVGRDNGIQRHLQSSQSNIRSLRVTLLLVLTVFLIVPFVLYST